MNSNVSTTIKNNNVNLHVHLHDHSQSSRALDDDSTEELKSPSCSKCGESNQIFVKYRPLVSSNGEFLCDLCYMQEFPATAMCDNAVQNKKHIKSAVSSSLNNSFRNSQQDPDYTEDEDCRICLEKGYLRKCCQQFYCHECFFGRSSDGVCPGCGEIIHRTGITAWKAEDPGRFAVALTYILSVLTVLTTILFVLIIIWNEMTFPKTIWGHTCAGWFPQCNIEICVNGMIESNGQSILGMPFTPQYEFCQLESTVHKIFGNICIFDQRLYQSSEQSMGFDFCYYTPRDTTQYPFNNGVYVFEDNFDHWIQPSFSSSSSNTISSNSDNSNVKNILMASATWQDMRNAKVSDICGVNLSPLSKKKKQLQSPTIQQTNENGALVFSGVHYRYAETANLDLSYGGKLEFFLKMAPISASSEEECRSAYSGDVSVLYSKDDGKSWEIIATYPVWKYRKENFTQIKENIPEEAWSNHTRIRWQQFLFDSRRDYWALDDVNIFHYFESDWMFSSSGEEEEQTYFGKRSEKYDKNTMIREESVHDAQCCFGTEHCKQYPTLNNDVSSSSSSSPSSSCDQFQGYNSKEQQIEPKTVELVVILAVVCCTLKKLYKYFFYRITTVKTRRVMTSNNNESSEEHNNHQDNTSSTQTQVTHHRTSSFVQKAFHLKTQTSWRIVIVILTSIPLLCCIVWMVVVFRKDDIYYWVLDFISRYIPSSSIASPSTVLLSQQQNPSNEYNVGLLKTYLSSPSFIYFIIAVIFDFRNILLLWSSVFVISDRWKRLIHVNTLPDVNVLSITTIRKKRKQGFKLCKKNRGNTFLSNNKSHGQNSNTICIPLSEIKDIQLFSTKFYWQLCFFYFLGGGIPYITLCIVMRTLWLPYHIYSLCIRTIGCIALLRELLGVEMWVRFFLSLRWILSRPSSSDNNPSASDDRDDMGNALKERRVLEWMKYVTPFICLFFWIFSAHLFRQDITQKENGEIISSSSGIKMFFTPPALIGLFSGLFLGMLYSSLYGMLLGLPVNPLPNEVLLTRWPTSGHWIRYNHKVRCPCIFNCVFCSSMNSRHCLMILFPQENGGTREEKELGEFMFRNLLKGEQYSISVASSQN